ncbi:hypothetical protein [Kribbella sp. VKM Ac-2569]|nr:hypothetical protein [Kribbella sp. VKM Ac-2569]
MEHPKVGIISMLRPVRPSMAGSTKRSEPVKGSVVWYAALAPSYPAWS